MFEASSLHRRGYYPRNFNYPPNVVYAPRQQQFEHAHVSVTRRPPSRPGFCGEDVCNSESIDFEELACTVVKGQPNRNFDKTAIDFFQMSQDTEGSNNFTLPLQSNTMEEMIKTFMACQKCKEISTKSKQLQCSHTICKKCAIQIRTRHVDPGQWMIRCLVCNLITTWYGKNLEGLQDNSTMHKMVQQTSSAPSKRLVKSKSGQITMYGEEDLTINIVSYSKEKAEIQKALESAEKKIQLCQQQTKQVKDYEDRVNKAKALIHRQIEQSVELFISSIRSHQAQLMEDLEDNFQKDLIPVKEARDAIEVQMQSLKLVTQCCSVASRVLQNGGAPLDLGKFKEMVWQTMKKTKAGKLPSAIQKTYKPNVIYKSNDTKFDEMAEKLGQLGNRKYHRKDSAVRAAKSSITPDIESVSVADDEPVYDLPPDLEIKYAQVNRKKQDQKPEEDIYDEIPFFSEAELRMGSAIPAEKPLSDECVPLPIEKDNHDTSLDDLPDFPPPPPQAFQLKNISSDSLEKAAALVASRRRAINGVKSDSDDDENTDDSFSSDSDEEDNQEEKPIQKGFLLRESSLQPKEGYETQPDHDNISRMIRRRSMKNINALSSHIQHLMGSNDSALLGLNSKKILFCIGKVKKPGLESTNVQQFYNPPEFTISDDDTVWISDIASHRIQIHEGISGKLAGMFKTAVQGVLLKPKGVTAFRKGKKIAVSCGKYATIWTEDGELVRQIGPHSDFGKLGGIATDSNEKLVLADVENNRIVITASNKIIPNAVGNTGNSAKSQWPGRIAINLLDQIICADYSSHHVKIFNKHGSLVTKFGSFGTGPGQFRYPSAVAVDRHNRIYVADECNNRISLFSADGKEFYGYVLTKDDGLAFPHTIDIFSDGAIAVADDSKIVKVYKGFDNLK
ncbi:uncharacterized protein LOC143464600 isoform X2 [Clavelina lepadiformis]|uniref:uncharacterized protein LOC143464600 isoform X2 n=1 Tax=Clavelina lepadiformis TaxID=159417 RepID=UPI004042BB32